MKNKFIFLITLFSSVFITLNSQVNFQWAVSYGSIGFDYAYSNTVDGAGNVYTTGVFTGTVDFDPGAGVYNLIGSPGGGDIFISKLDGAGNFIWAKRIGGMGPDGGFSLTVDALNNLYLTGIFVGTVDFDPSAAVYNLSSIGSNDVFIIKLDATGSFVWAKSFGGFNNDFGYSIAVDVSGNVYTTGYFYGTVDFDPGVGVFNLASSGNKDIFLNKLDASGIFVWSKNIGGTTDDWGSSVVVDVTNKVYITGFFSGTMDFDPGVGITNITSAGQEDIFVSKFDQSGNFLWGKAMGGTLSDWGSSIAVDVSGNVYSTGYFNSTADFDPGVGVSNLTSVGTAGMSDIFITKLDAVGTFVWARQMGGLGNDNSTSISLDGIGNIYITGIFELTADFDPGIGVYNFTSAGAQDVFINKLDVSGNFVWAKQLGSSGFDVGQSIKLDGSSNVFLTGYFQNTVDFDPGVGIYNMTYAGGYDIFILKLSNTVGIEEKDNSINSVNIFPNPNTGAFKLQITNDLKNGELILINSIGERVCEQTVIQGVNTINANNLSKGLYNYILLSDKQKVAGGKIVLE